MRQEGALTVGREPDRRMSGPIVPPTCQLHFFDDTVNGNLFFSRQQRLDVGAHEFIPSP